MVTHKHISFILILFIIYISYDYCSDKIEGLDSTCPDPGSPPDKIDGLKSLPVKAPCFFKQTSCNNLMTNVGDEWNSFYTDYNPSEGPGVDSKGWTMKQQCERCMRGSSKMGQTLNLLANVSNKIESPEIPTHSSKFSLDYCDALAAKCGSPLFYANNRQNWEQYDCSGVTIGNDEYSKTSQFLCSLLTNNVIQFFMGFLGGATCTLKIKALELETSLSHIPDDIFCLICSDDVPGVPDCNGTC
jgi:hypothetical protein|tara:strand:- start:729 stop:1460 length:732 start_codon:yes stop_codon:yes gene_type:complete